MQGLLCRAGSGISELYSGPWVTKGAGYAVESVWDLKIDRRQVKDQQLWSSTLSGRPWRLNISDVPHPCQAQGCLSGHSAKEHTRVYLIASKR